MYPNPLKEGTALNKGKVFKQIRKKGGKREILKKNVSKGGRLDRIQVSNRLRWLVKGSVG
jgi:hypothetical protein